MTRSAPRITSAVDSRFAESPVPARAGAGLKAEHIDAILADEYKIGFVEVHAENYMGAGGHPHRSLSAIRDEIPLSVHGVGLSIGSEMGLNPEHLLRLKKVVDQYNPGLVSEHLAWSTHDDSYFNDLLPVPYDDATLARVVSHVSQVQDTLGRQILLENPSTYFAFEQSTMSETDFIREIARQSGCSLLLDINNVLVSATNHGYKPMNYLKNYPLDLVGEIHLAGHAEDVDDEGEPILIDAHDREVCEEVWRLYDIIIGQTGPLPTLVEWDNDVPDWPVLRAEAQRADAILASHADTYMLGSRHAVSG